MALSSVGKTFLDRLRLVIDWKFNYQKHKVINSLTYVDESLENLVNSPFALKFDHFEYWFNNYGTNRSIHRKSLHYEDLLFLTHMIKNWSFDLKKLSKYEQQDYELAVEKIKTWEIIIGIMMDVEKFVAEIKRIIFIRINAEHSQNFFVYMYPEYEWSTVSRYHAILLQLEPYPDWTEKVKRELEPWLIKLAYYAPVMLSTLPLEVYSGLDFHSYFQ